MRIIFETAAHYKFVRYDHRCVIKKRRQARLKVITDNKASENKVHPIVVGSKGSSII